MQTVTWAGSSYNIPNQRGDTPWSGLSDFAIAVAAKGLNTGGGNFTLLADVNTGATFGFVSAYFKSRTANIATAGVLRLAKTDVIDWRNNANGANLPLGINVSDQLTFNSVILATAAATLTASRALVSDGSGNITVATTTATEIGYVNGVTSAIQTQINTKATGTINSGGANRMAYYSAATAITALPALAINKAIVSDASGLLDVSTTSATELGYVTGVTSAIQTQINSVSTVANAALPKAGGTMSGAIAMGTNKITGLGNGTAAQDAVAFGQLHYKATPIQGTSTTSVSSSSSTFQTSNCAASITPSTASSLVKITAVFTAKLSSGAADAGRFTLFRGTTNLGPAAGMVTLQVVSAVNQLVPCTLIYLDSPSTTSATTYIVKYSNVNGVATVGVGSDFSSDQQTMILEEVI